MPPASAWLVRRELRRRDRSPASPEEEPLEAIRVLLPCTANGKAEAEIAEALGVPKVQVRDWARLLVDEGIHQTTDTRAPLDRPARLLLTD